MSNNLLNNTTSLQEVLEILQTKASGFSMETCQIDFYDNGSFNSQYADLTYLDKNCNLIQEQRTFSAGEFITIAKNSIVITSAYINGAELLLTDTNESKRAFLVTEDCYIVCTA